MNKTRESGFLLIDDIKGDTTMQVRYINLDNAIERREILEKSFIEHKGTDYGWSIQRFSAFTPNNPEVKTLTNSLTEAEKACLLGHYQILLEAKPDDHYLWILEDDSIFTESSFKTVSSFLKNHGDTQWDILYTAIDPTSPTIMFEFFYHRQQVQQGSAKIIGLENIQFASSNSYIVNLKNISNLIRAIDDINNINNPWDLFLSDCINKKKLTAYALIPFATKLSTYTMNSQIENKNHGLQQLVFYYFRELMNLTCDIDLIQSQIDQIGKHDNETKRLNCFGKLIALISSKDFQIR